MIAPASRAPPTGRSALLAPAELSTLEVEPHAAAAERPYAEHAVDPFGIPRGARVEDEPVQRVPAIVTERCLAQLVTEQVRGARRVLDDFSPFQGSGSSVTGIRDLNSTRSRLPVSTRSCIGCPRSTDAPSGTARRS